MFEESQDSSPVVAAQRPSANPLLDFLDATWRWILRILFVVMLTIYIGWNLFWLAQGRLAPSLFQAMTGFPCPTTGCTRSFFALCRGEFLESLQFNALMLPICVLIVVTAMQLCEQFAKRKKLALWPGLVAAWGIILPVAWILKLAGDPRYW